MVRYHWLSRNGNHVDKILELATLIRGCGGFDTFLFDQELQQSARGRNSANPVVI